MRLAVVIALLALFNISTAQAQVTPDVNVECKFCIKTDPVLKGLDKKTGQALEVRASKDGFAQLTVDSEIYAQGFSNRLSMIAIRTDPVLSTARTLVAGYDQISGDPITLRQDRKGNVLLVTKKSAWQLAPICKNCEPIVFEY